MTTLKSGIATLRSDVDQLKSTDMSMIIRTMKITNVQDMPLSTTGDEVRGEDATDLEFGVEMDEKIVELATEVSYEGLTVWRQ